jgi:hypothetical protein
MSAAIHGDGRSGRLTLPADLRPQLLQNPKILRRHEEPRLHHRREDVMGLAPMVLRRCIPLLLQHVGDLHVRHPQVALPRGVAEVGLGQALADAQGIGEEPLRELLNLTRHDHSCQ